MAANKQTINNTPDDNETTTENPSNQGDVNQDNECQAILNKKDYYEILGIPKSSDDIEIKRAYKKVLMNFCI